MTILFEKMDAKHQKGVMDIFNYYIESGTSAFPNKALPEQFYAMLLKKSEGYPAYALIDKDNNAISGFCQLSSYNPFSTFAKTACLTYFISPDYTRKGLGSECLQKLEDEAKLMGVEHLIAEISSENKASIFFHAKHGFLITGELHDIGNKFDRKFGIVYMEKAI